MNPPVARIIARIVAPAGTTHACSPQRCGTHSISHLKGAGRGYACFDRTCATSSAGVAETRKRPPGIPRLTVDGLQHALRLGDAVTLRVIDAQRREHLDDLGVLGELGNGLLAREVTDFVDRTHHLAVDGVVQDFPDERAVDLEEVDREMLEVTER